MMRSRSVIPGFGLTMGLTLTWLSLIVLAPLAALFVKTSELTPLQFWTLITGSRTLHALQLSFGLSLVAAAINLVFGSLIAWALVRYKFPLRGVFDAIVDIPFALPTAVAGIALTALYANNGWMGQFGENIVRISEWLDMTWVAQPFGSIGLSLSLRGTWAGGFLEPLGVPAAFSPWGILIALVFVGLPFVVRTVQPVLIDLEPELEEAAASLGANRWQTITKVIMPALMPAALTGFALAFARAVGEYGSVIFIAGNLPGVSEIAPLLIVIRLEEYRYADATAIAVVMLVASFIMLLVINWLQRWSEKRR